MITVIRNRIHDVAGYAARPEDVDHLELQLAGLGFDWLLKVFHEFRVCGMIVSFEIAQSGAPRTPSGALLSAGSSDRQEEYHEFYWANPKHIAWELHESRAGPSLLAAGFILIGDCAFGGDPYYLKADPSVSNRWGLFRAFSDWIEPDAANPVPPEALGVVCADFAQVLRVARFLHGLTEGQ